MTQKKEIRLLAEAIVRDVEVAGPYPMRFDYGFLSEDDRVRVEALQRRSFELWASTWITPRAKRIVELIKK